MLENVLAVAFSVAVVEMCTPPPPVAALLPLKVVRSSVTVPPPAEMPPPVLAVAVFPETVVSVNETEGGGEPALAPWVMPPPFCAAVLLRMTLPVTVSVDVCPVAVPDPLKFAIPPPLPPASLFSIVLPVIEMGPAELVNPPPLLVPVA